MLAKLFDKGEEAGHNEFFIYDTFHCEIVKTKSGSLPSPRVWLWQENLKGAWESGGRGRAGGGEGDMLENTSTTSRPGG